MKIFIDDPNLRADNMEEIELPPEENKQNPLQTSPHEH